MDIERTKKFYETMKISEICQCAYCKNYVKNIKKNYPEVAKYLANLGIDIEKPFEAMPSEVDKNGYIEYVGVQYIIMGDKEDFNKVLVSGVQLDIAKSHPTTDIQEKHFVIEMYPIVLKWVM